MNPRILRRNKFQSTSFLIAVGVAAVLALVLQDNATVRQACIFASVLAMVGLAITVGRGEGRLLKYVRRHQYLVCRSCGYALDGLQSVGVCPECGADFNTDALEREWKRDLGEATGEDWLKDAFARLQDLPFPAFAQDEDLSDWQTDLAKFDGHVAGLAATALGGSGHDGSDVPGLLMQAAMFRSRLESFHESALRESDGAILKACREYLLMVEVVIHRLG